MSKQRTKKSAIKIGVFGGSGFYDLLDQKKEYEIKTPYGRPSDKIMVGEIEGKQAAFLPRHGKGHKLPPHRIPYKANFWAFKELGVEYLIAPCAVGSLKAKLKPGDFVVVDDFFDRTKLRDDTFFNGPRVAHFSFDKPYCEDLRKLAIKVCQQQKISFHKKGVVVVIEGPRFSTKTESKWYQSKGFDVINMTHYPEVVLARELEMCFCSIGLVTDYDNGLEGNPKIKPVSADQVAKVMKYNVDKVKKVVKEMVKNIEVDKKRKCSCAQAGQAAFL